MIRLYNVLRKTRYLSDADNTEGVAVAEEEIPSTEEVAEPEVETNAGLNKALDTYRKLIEKKVDEESKDTPVNLDNQPKDPFTEKKVQSLWIEYYQERQNKGEKSIASILELELPKLNENYELSVSLPSKLMKEQLEREQPKLLGFLKKALNNYSITLKINVVKTVKQKIAYTTREKYEELKAKNPLLDKLRQTFELDL